MSKTETVYDMKMLFKLSVSIKELNAITENLDKSKLVCEDALTLELTITLPVIPTKEMIEQYADVLKQSFNDDTKNKLYAEKVTFVGYEYLNPREIEINESDSNQMTNQK